MENLKSYTSFLSKFFEECELKSVTWDTEDDDLWLATFESKSGKTRQYKTNRQTMLAFCKKFYRDWAKFEDAVVQYDLDGNEIARFRGQNEAGRLTGISGANISQVCNNKRKTAGGFIWRYEV